MPSEESFFSERLKRATALTIKAIGRREALEVAFATEPLGPAATPLMGENVVMAAPLSNPSPSLSRKRLGSNHALAFTGKVSAARVKLPLLPVGYSPEKLAAMRGAADSAALRLRHHDAKFHARAAPKESMGRLAFDALEQARCEALGARAMAGVAANVAALAEARCASLGCDAADSKAEVPMAEALHVLALGQFSGTVMPKAAQQAATLWRGWIEQRVGASLGKLPDLLHDQKAFATEAKRIIKALDPSLPGGDEPDEGKTRELDEGSDGLDQEESPQSASQAEGGEGDMPEPDTASASEAMQAESREQKDTSGQQISGEDIQMGADPAGGAERQDEEEEEGSDAPRTTYRAFTTVFDEIKSAKDLCSPEELTRLRAELDRQVRPMMGMVARLANRLQRRLMARQTRSWDFDLEEGLLDAARLARIVTSPSHALTFKREKNMEFRDTVVSLLIDNSGSMRGRPITLAAMSADILAHTLERCGVKTEILGFTTAAWKGGNSRNAWIKAGKPQFPGRLNDILHIVYKSADEPWRRARRNLGLMLREGLLKENIDGEALLWAYKRLKGRPEKRRILMVISDGAPVDDSTLSVNPGNYLEQHLRAVIGWIESRPAIELVAIGIGHDVTRTYRRAVTISDMEQLGRVMMEQLGEIFAIRR
ncbi:MAG: cobaltochelatase subunit CobT [Bdellovibrionales bacterium]